MMVVDDNDDNEDNGGDGNIKKHKRALRWRNCMPKDEEGFEEKT